MNEWKETKWLDKGGSGGSGIIDHIVCPICKTGRSVRDAFDKLTLSNATLKERIKHYAENIAVLEHEAENQANRIQELEDLLDVHCNGQWR